MSKLALRGLVILYVVLLVVVPLMALAYHALASGPSALWDTLNHPMVQNAWLLTLGMAAIISLIDAVMGTLTAWVLVRYRFFGRRVLSALVDLPFAIPTLVTGVMLVTLLGPISFIGRNLQQLGISLIFAKPGIILALLFITVPFVVRAVEPVLIELDSAEEEAARVLGATPWQTFRLAILPALWPSIAYGTMQCFARAIAEFGSVVVVSGNIPNKTLTMSVLIYGEIEGGHSERAAAISLWLIGIAAAVSFTAQYLKRFVRPTMELERDSPH